ncbi:D-aminoacyl-tRNA deacylase [Mesoterricola silvestris]|uniref:D-aminoacyl-tRNA deacylase n=1 Tax=Mesoterricola silvestris TaxID=2927979 RepID=A0AA48GWV1_9BACT|nr:D-aminoacyl-tRNA deacylase [Mesoterricola silvestris]BDU73336.1 D-aminoacyl-tRNA deacylase [Mesoterricola silvestris]
MKAVIQRVKRAEVRSGAQSAAIGPGLLVLAGLERGDTEETCQWAAARIAGLRVFEDPQGRMNLSLQDTGGEILVISQFTLAGSLQRGRRPSFDGAMAPEEARELFGAFADLLEAQWPRVKRGFFREHMEVELVNDGPATFILER